MATLDAGEIYAIGKDEPQQTTIAIHCTFKVRKSMGLTGRDKEILKETVLRTAAKHMRLCAVPDWESPNSSRTSVPLVCPTTEVSNLPINYEYFTAATRVASESLLNDRVQYHMNTNNDVNGLLWRVTLVTSPGDFDEKRIDLVMSYCHALGDGMSAGIFAKSFREELENMIQEQSNGEHQNTSHAFPKKQEAIRDNRIVNSTPPDFSVLPYKHISPRNLFSFALFSSVMAFNTLRGWCYKTFLGATPATLPTPWLDESRVRNFGTSIESSSVKLVERTGFFPDHEAVHSERLTAVSYFSLNADQTLSLRNTCRSNGTTVTGALLASSSFAFTKVAQLVAPKAKLFTYSFSSNLRSLVPPEQQLAFGNCASNGIAVKLPLHVTEQPGGLWFWTNARKMKKKIWDTSRSAAVFSKLAGMVTMRPRYPDLCFSLANLGVSLDDSVGSAHHIVELVSAQGMLNTNSTGAPMWFMVSIATTNGCLRGTVTSSVGEARCQSFAKAMRESLIAVLPTSQTVANQ